MLHLHGREHPHTGLHKKAKGIQFSETIDIRDPATNQVDRKDAKNFMINQTCILLDRDQLVLSMYDDTLWKQMMDYQVVRISQSGKPIYTSENEHALDAFMLTILGFTIEFPEITKILEKNRIATQVSPVKQHSLEDRIKEKLYDESLFSAAPTREIEAKDNPNWHWEKVKIGQKRNHAQPFSRSGSLKSFRRSRF